MRYDNSNPKSKYCSVFHMLKQCVMQEEMLDNWRKQTLKVI